MSVVSEVVRRLAAAGTVDAAGHDVLAVLAQDLGWDVALLWMPSEDGGLLQCAAAWTAGEDGVEEFVRACRRLTFAAGAGLPGRVWTRAERRFVPRLEDDPEFARADIAARAGLVSAVAVPVAGSGGVIELLSRTEQPTDPQRDALLETVAAQLGHFAARLRAEERLHRSEERAAAIFEAALDCVITMDGDGLVLDFNRAAEETFGYSREDAIGHPLAELIVPPELRPAHRAGLRRYLETREPRILDRRLELDGMRADGTTFPVELTVTRVGRGEPPLFAGFVRDITDRRDAEADRRGLMRKAVASRAREEAARVRAESAHEEAERDRRRLEFLAGAGLRMASSMDYETTLAEVADAAVPRLADRCTVTIAETSGVRALGGAGVPERALEALRTGEPVREPRTLTVPIRASGRVLGAITLEMAEGGREFGDGDVVVTTALAARAGLHIENARLYTERSQIAATLQRSLLPAPLPEVAELELAAHYRPAGDQNAVGGDFYDVFASEPGTWTAVVGDVSGKGAGAAALTALSRNTLFAGAMRERSPARNLGLLNEAMRRRRQDASFCTVVLARLCPGPDSTLVTLAAGGHPPPLLVRASGEVERVPLTGTLVGVVADAQFEERDLRLGRGDLLLLYTDGAIELRRSDLELGERQLAATLREHAGRSAGEVVAALGERIDALRDGSPRDDVALLAIRMRPDA